MSRKKESLSFDSFLVFVHLCQADSQVGPLFAGAASDRPGDRVGYDAHVRGIVFPLEGNLCGRSISAAAPLTGLPVLTVAGMLGHKSYNIRK